MLIAFVMYRFILPNRPQRTYSIQQVTQKTDMNFSKSRRRLRTGLLVFLGLLITPWPALPTENEPAPMQRMTRAASLAVESQKKMESWLAEKDTLLQAVRDDRHELDNLRYLEKKYLFQIKKEQNILSELEKERQETERMLMELEPELAARVDALADSIDADLPFLRQERRERVAMLRESLMDHRLGLDVKLQRVLEAHLIEAGYGRSVEALIRSINLKGEATTVHIFRLGRLGLYYLTMDNTEAGHWSRDKAAWVSLPSSMISTLNTAMNIARRRQAAELVELPVGRP